jgi:hypothetical protein
MGQNIAYTLLPLGKAPVTGVDEVQTVVVSATGGTFTLNGSTAIAWNATVAVLQAVLDVVFGIGNTVVSGTPSNYTVTFAGSLSGIPVALMTSDATNLTGGASTATVAEGTLGVKGSYRGVPAGVQLIDTANGNLWENTGNKAKPVWTALAVI